MSESPEKEKEPTVANRSPDGMRVELWRQANRDRYNARQKDLMRRNRAKLKDA